MSLETSGLCKLVHKKSDFYKSSSRSNEPIFEPSENIFNNKSTFGQLIYSNFFIYANIVEGYITHRQLMPSLSHLWLYRVGKIPSRKVDQFTLASGDNAWIASLECGYKPVQ